MALVEFDEIVDFEQMYSQRDSNEPFKKKSGDSAQFVVEVHRALMKHLQFESKNDLELPIAEAYASLFTSTHTTITRDRKMKAVLYLSEGLTRIGGDLHEDELLIWKYFLAKAYKRLVLKSHQTGFEKHLHKKWRAKAIQLFYEVIRGTDQMTMLNENKKEILKTNKARSYVNIGHILQHLPQGEDKSYYCSFIQHAEFGKLLETPSIAFEIGKSIQSDDISVLVYYEIIWCIIHGAYKKVQTRRETILKKQLNC